MKFDIQVLNQYREEGKLISQFHPVHPLIIWNYSQKVQYEQLWDEITINCRGLVTDFDGNVISKGFPKFWNLEEGKHIPTQDFEICTKYDGQYIGAFMYNGELIVNSRGSFTSIYAQKAKEILETKYKFFLDKFPSNHTACFELIGYEQIVVSYPEEDLIATGLFDSYGFELSLSDRSNLYGIPIAKRYSGLDYTKIKELNWKNSEGFVVKFRNGSRCKVKFDDYCNLHRQMTNLSTTGIWEALSQGIPVSSILNDVPDEFFAKVKEYEERLKFKYSHLENRCANICQSIQMTNPPSRKEYAEAFKKYDSPIQSVLFAMLDRKDYSKIIWKFLKPEFEKL